ncbi:nucleoside hydrolase [Acetobacteraceae bacterium KSS8]|uniref:Nucleoside hydrolase n=1 Tax=Endosaccharibacter trunci TaxID=2812733 RepID=A0ABT1WC35_9PROT|nr:nucleoside hydrolase [Acetobacteraceae bacterium KSS8]
MIVDTDIGDDIDDAFALALVLHAPSLHLVAVSATLGDTALRARLARRFLDANGRSDVPVYAGPVTPPHTAFTQAAYARGGSAPPGGFPDAVDALLARLRAAPDRSITLLALAPMTTIGAMIRRDPVAFGRLRAVVMMGGSIRRGYPFGPSRGGGPDPEYNVVSDPDGLRALLGSGVPVEMMPLDATLVPLEPADRDAILNQPDETALRALFAEWHERSPYADHPTMFDVVPVAHLLRPDLCREQPMHIVVDNEAFTREEAGPPNASACLQIDPRAVSGMLRAALAK